jgi:hypothetical protein
MNRDRWLRLLSIDVHVSAPAAVLSHSVVSLPVLNHGQSMPALGLYGADRRYSVKMHVASINIVHENNIDTGHMSH